MCVCVCAYEPGGELQTSSGTLDVGPNEDTDWEEEREMERVACEGEDFIPPKIMVRILANEFKIGFEVQLNICIMFSSLMLPRMLRFLCMFFLLSIADIL